MRAFFFPTSNYAAKLADKWQKLWAMAYLSATTNTLSSAVGT